ncbi:MAG: GatB/YqeY domain-containing protein [Bacteroidetes bacterium]|jgi:uncharacterized protein|nr:GatB/YqeY domain-containing protein [Bacteroidota bacterium]
MSIVEQVNADIKTAMLAKERAKLDALRAIKSALMLEATKGSNSEVDDELATKVIMKLHKQRKEAAEIYAEQGREDLESVEIAQAEVLQTYLPQPMAEADLKAALEAIIAEVGATGPQDMGKVMGKASGALAGKADGKAISTMVKQLLAG